MSEAWRASVTVAAVIECDGKFLLVEELADGRRVLNQPAGHLDPGESLLEACVRETLEETAYALAPAALVGIYRWRHEPSDTTFLRFAIAGSAIGPDPARRLDKEIIATHWLTPAQLAAQRAMHRSPLVARCVADYLAGARFPLEVLSREFA